MSRATFWKNGCFDELVFCAVLAIGATAAQLPDQKKENGGIPNDRTVFATNRRFSKGGLGIVNKKLYIVVSSTKTSKNKLIVKPTEETEKHWSGQSVSKPEFVVFYPGIVWPTTALPDGFDLSKAVIVSFESDKVRFFDFQ
jgi:hypothetical protein